MEGHDGLLHCTLCAGTKYLALLFIVVLSITSVAITWRYRRCAAPALFVGVTALVIFPWYARIIYYTGNPVFPFCERTFGMTAWSFENLRFSDAELARIRASKETAAQTGLASIATATVRPGAAEAPAVSPAPAGRWARLAALAIAPIYSAGCIVSHGLSDIPGLIMLPWNISHRRDLFDESPLLSPALLLGVPALVLVGASRLRSRWLLALAVVYTLLWYTHLHDLRYALPVVPLYALATAEALDALVLMIPAPPALTSHWIFSLAGCIALSLSGWQYAASVRDEFGPVPTDQQERDEFLTSHAPRPAPVQSSLPRAYLARYASTGDSSYPAYQLLNARRGDKYTVYALYDEHMAYFAAGTFLGDWLGPMRYANIEEVFTDGRALYQALRGMGADYLVIAMDRVPVQVPQDAFFQDHFLPIYDREVIVYELMENAAARTAGPELLQNGGFEELWSDGQPLAWTSAGTPLVDSSGQRSDGSKIAVCARGIKNACFQSGVPVTAGAVYRLRFRARAEAPGQVVRMQLTWALEGRDAGPFDIRVVAAATEWRTYEMTTVAPQNAESVTVAASPQDEAAIWFDNFSLVEIRHERGPGLAPVARRETDTSSVDENAAAILSAQEKSPE